MSNAGYGNHGSAPERASPEAGATKPATDATASATDATASAGGGTDRPGVDLGGASDESARQVVEGTRAVPDAGGTGPHSGLSDPNSPTLTDDTTSTPGAGTLPGGAQGNESDPAAG